MAKDKIRLGGMALTNGVLTNYKPLPDGKLRVRVEYVGATGKAQSMVCEGSASMIQDALKQLPKREHDAILASLQQIGLLNSDKSSVAPGENKR